jgi:hypothetical protein
MSFTQPSLHTNPINFSFDQTLGLDLASGYDYDFPDDGGYRVDTALGLDMMGEVEVVPRQKKKKIAWVEIKSLIDGE